MNKALSIIFGRTKETGRFKKKNWRKKSDIQRKRCLTATIEDLTKDADKYALDAAKKKDIQLLERSSNLQSLVRQKKMS